MEALSTSLFSVFSPHTLSGIQHQDKTGHMSVSRLLLLLLLLIKSQRRNQTTAERRLRGDQWERQTGVPTGMCVIKGREGESVLDRAAVMWV